MHTNTGDRTNAVALWEPGWFQVLWHACCRAIVVVLVCLIACTMVPAVADWTPHLIETGSMAPALSPGDVVVTRPLDRPPVVGQVLTVRDPDVVGRTRTHRLVRVDTSDRLVLRGDANGNDDSSPVARDDVIGVGVLRAPAVGRPLVWWHEGHRVRAMATMLALVVCGYGALRRPRPPAPGSQDPPPSSPNSRRSARRRGRAAGVASGIALSLVVGPVGPAEAALTSKTASTSSMAASAVFRPYRAAVLADSPHLYWRLRETTGTAVDDAGTGNRDGTLTGTSPTRAVASPLASEPDDRSWTFASARITSNASTTTPSTFSVEAWVRSTSTAGGRILGFGDGAGSTASATTDAQLYLATTGRLVFGVGANKTVVQSGTGFNNGAWHHVVGTYAAGTNNMKLYVNGSLVAQGTATVQSFTGSWRAGGETMSGWAGNPTSNVLAGSLDELAVYPTALTSTRVSAHYAARN